MKIGIMSDIHDHAKNLILATNRFNDEKCDLVICCGDWGSPAMPNFCTNLSCKIISVFGNNDADIFSFLKRAKEKNWNMEFNKYCVELELDGKKIVVYHGDSEPLLQGLLDGGKYDLVFSGHTHKALIKQIKNTTHINPGSITNIYIDQLDRKATIAIYDTKTNKSEIITLN